jgi:predicted NAD/FAD-binding protein
MNSLQRLRTSRPYFVTLNPARPVPAASVIKEMLYTHPCYTRRAVATQAELPALNGVRRTFFAGSYFGYGFHEDAVRSALLAAQAFGAAL